jgi:hypothetical protein
MNGGPTLTRWGFAVRGLITVILGVVGVVFAALPLAIVVAAVVYVAAGVGSLWQLAQRRNEPVASLVGRADLLLRREIIWIYLVIAVGYEAIVLEGVLLRGALATTTGVLVYIGGVCTQIVRRREERPISYRKYLEQYTADQNN